MHSRRARLALLTAAIGAVGCVLVVRGLTPDTLSRADLLARIPWLAAPAPPKPLSGSFIQSLTRSVDDERCPPPLDLISRGFKPTPREYIRYDRNPKVSLVVDGKGDVVHVGLLESSGSTELDQRVVEWLSTLRHSTQSRCGGWKIETSVIIGF